MELRDELKARQFRWVLAQGYAPDTRGYVGSLTLNLLQTMSPDTMAEFSCGLRGAVPNRPARQASESRHRAVAKVRRCGGH